MARALENLDRDPTYLEFFGMTRPPFARLTAPSEIFHSEQCSLLNAHLTNATEQSDSLIVICGADGTGKTTLLNQYISGLGEDVSYAAFDETCRDGTQFYCAFLRQLGFSEITGSLRELRRITREFLIHRGIAGDPVLVFLDNAHLVTPSVLEQLRWISDTTVEDRRVLSIVVAGNSDLMRIMDSPAMQQLRFQSHVNFNIRVFTEAETEHYVRHRLRLAGGAEATQLSDEARKLIYRFTGGIASSINSLCHAVLTESLDQETRVISGQLIRKVAERNQILPHVVPLKGKGRRKTDPDTSLAEQEQQTEERITARDASTKPAGNSLSQGPLIPDADVKELLLQVAELSDQLDASKAATRTALRDIDRRDKDIDELRERLTVQATETSALAQVIAGNETEIQRLSHTLSDNANQHDKSETAAKKLALDFEKQQELIAEKSRESDVLETSLEKSAAEIERLNQTLAASQKELADSKEISRKLATDVEKLENSGADELIRDFRKQVKAQAKELDNLAATIESKDEEIERLDQALAASEKALATKSGESDKLAATVDSDAEEIERLNQALATSEKALADSEELSRRLATDVEKLENSGTDELIRDLREQAKTQAKKLDKLSTTVDSDAEEIEHLNQELAASKKALAIKTGESDQLATTIDSNAEEIGRLNQALAASEKALAIKSGESDQLATTVDRKAAEVESLKQALAEHDEALMDSERSSKKLAAELKKEQSASKRAKKDVDRAKARIEKLDQMKIKLQSSVSDITVDLRLAKKQAAKLGTLEKSLEKSQEECASLKVNIDALKSLEESVTERDARIAALEAELAAFATASTTTQARLPQKDAKPRSKAKSRSKGKPAESGCAIAAIDIYHGRKKLQVFKLSEGESRIMIGRGDDSDVKLDSKFVSRHHALVFCSGTRVHIEDLHSFNGTLVNSKKVSRCNLQPGDSIIIGDFELRPRKA
ncbi:MAG: FHA domain-containing protein [Gammaproteobacteria bacterium]|nr:FHA domain-containing protein [Gammaproteobacteria bacterium]NNL50383.1 FHA domain-containing protein [Woeseiaceae bacterium]